MHEGFGCFQACHCSITWPRWRLPFLQVAYSTRFTGGKFDCCTACHVLVQTCLPGQPQLPETHSGLPHTHTHPLPHVAAAEEKDISTSRYRTSVCAVPLAAPAIVEVGGVAELPEVPAAPAPAE